MANVTVRFEADSLLRLTKEVQAKFGAPLAAALKAAHEDMAKHVQRGVADRLEQETQAWGRPQGYGRTGQDAHRGGTLGRVVMNDKNRSVTPGGFAVGLEDFYNRSAAKRYWRQIESGAPGFWSFGLFADPGGPSAPNRSLAGTQARYPQMRSSNRAPAMGVWAKAFAGHEYHAGGFEAFNRMDKAGKYSLFLGQVGISLSTVGRGGKYSLSASS